MRTERLQGVQRRLVFGGVVGSRRRRPSSLSSASQRPAHLLPAQAQVQIPHTRCCWLGAHLATNFSTVHHN
ncbi:unnamed protein product [Caenorhabditis auriculariae]|uniref:Uncharacterized protein n=1 Tax=Caenorhabditis auriculariae TaxID=2777116 RepID=A0A8S1H9W5_9PELO|nr:unnamed protein product [Caenorhabditis auriculariae]